MGGGDVRAPGPGSAGRRVRPVEKSATLPFWPVRRLPRGGGGPGRGQGGPGARRESIAGRGDARSWAAGAVYACVGLVSELSKYTGRGAISALSERRNRYTYLVTPVTCGNTHIQLSRPVARPKSKRVQNR